MSGFDLVIHVGEITQLVKNIRARIGDPSPLMADTLLLFERSTALNFQAQGRPDKWDDLAPSTERRRFAKAMRGRGGVIGSLGVLGSIEILRDNGLLLQSVTGTLSGPFEVADGFGISDKYTAELGTNRPGADALQVGNPANNLVARPYMLIQPQDEEDIAGMTADFLLGVGPYSLA